DLLAELMRIPGARRTLLALADAVRRHEAPAAELILLPEGGELTRERVRPVLRAFARVRRIEGEIAQLEARQRDRRATAVSRHRRRAAIERLEAQMGHVLRDQPIRPSLIDDLVAELRRLDRELEAAGRLPSGPERQRALRELTRRTG